MCHCVGQRTNNPTSRPGGVWSSQWIQAGLVFRGQKIPSLVSKMQITSGSSCRMTYHRLSWHCRLSILPPFFSTIHQPILLGEFPPVPSVLAVCQIAPQRKCELLPQLFFRVSTPSRSITSLPANSLLSRIYRKPVCDPVNAPQACLPCRLCRQRLPPWAARPSLAIAV